MKTGKKRLLAAFLVFFAVLAGVAAGLVQLYLNDLPQLRFLEEYRPSASTRILDARGRLAGELFEERRKPIRLGQVSPLLVKAVLAVEDERFFDHVGVDFKAIFRALWADLRAQSFAQGGSTITQQLTRGLFLENDKSVKRKVKEAILAVQIENRYTKEEILELYVNQIYLGSGVYGVEAAARRYFGKSAADLNLPEAALLAGLPKAPSAYDPTRFPDKARQRRGIVLSRMLALRAVTPDEHAAAMEAPLGVIPSAGGNLAPWFIEQVRQYLEERYGYETVYKRGLEVHTTLDLDLQSAAQECVRGGLESLDREGGWRIRDKAADPGPVDENLSRGALSPGVSFPARIVQASGNRLMVRAGKVEGVVRADAKVFPFVSSFAGKLREGQTVLVKVAGEIPPAGPLPLTIDQRPLLQGGLVAIDPRTGAVRAMVGGYDFAASKFNRAVQAHRQPGSAIKPLLYGAAVEAGWTPAGVLVDEPVKYWNTERKEYWEPKNYDDKFEGTVTLVESLTHSRNVPTIRLLEKLGVGPATGFIRRMGISSPMDPNLSLALGTSSVDLLEITSAYAVFANAGVRCSPMMVTRIVDAEGRTLETREPDYEKVLEPGVAYVTLDMMRSVINYGTGVFARDLGIPLAGKTGTTNDFQDAWFIGFSPTLAAGVWVGYDDNRTMGYAATGARMAGPIWKTFMGTASAGRPAEDFRPPDDVVFAEIDVKSGYLAGPNCPGGRPVAFLKGTEPRRECPRPGGGADSLTGEGR
jgi:penicillin-binding protein 1A